MNITETLMEQSSYPRLKITKDKEVIMLFISPTKGILLSTKNELAKKCIGQTLEIAKPNIYEDFIGSIQIKNSFNKLLEKCSKEMDECCISQNYTVCERCKKSSIDTCSKMKRLKEIWLRLKDK